MKQKSTKHAACVTEGLRIAINGTNTLYKAIQKKS